MALDERAQVRHGRHEVLGTLLRVELAEQCDGLLLVARIAAGGSERVRREGDEAVHREAPCDVLDVRTEAAVLVDHDDASRLAAHFRGHREVALAGAGALRRRILDPFGLDARVARRDHLAPGEIGTQCLEHCRRGKASDGVLARALDEPAPREAPVDVAVEEVQDRLREIGSLQSLHHHTRHLLSLTIGWPGLHAKACVNSGMFTTSPFTRYLPGECGSVIACTRWVSGG